MAEIPAAPPPPPPALAPRGWFPDPRQPKLERWWTGTEWSGYTHRRLGALSFDPRYTRSYWIGPNRNAGRARNFTQLGTILLLAAVVVVCLIGATVVGGPLWTWLLLAALVLSLLLHVGGIVFGRLGLLAADTLGARGACISSIVTSSIEILLCTIGILVLIVLLAVSARV